MNKIILVLLFVSCVTDQKEEPVKIIESKCTYKYFLKNDGGLDSSIIECPDPKPPKE